MQISILYLINKNQLQKDLNNNSTYMFHRLQSMVQAKLNETISIFSFYYNKVQKKDAKKPKKRQIEELQMAKKKVQKFGWLEGERRV